MVVVVVCCSQVELSVEDRACPNTGRPAAQLHAIGACKSLCPQDCRMVPVPLWLTLRRAGAQGFSVDPVPLLERR